MNKAEKIQSKEFGDECYIMGQEEILDMFEAECIIALKQQGVAIGIASILGRIKSERYNIKMRLKNVC